MTLNGRQFGKTLFTRDDGGELVLGPVGLGSSREYAARPSMGGGNVASVGAHLTVHDYGPESSYAYGTSTPRVPEPSPKFQAWHDTATRMRATHGWSPHMAQGLMDLGEAERPMWEKVEEHGLNRVSIDSSEGPDPDLAIDDLAKDGPGRQGKLFGSFLVPGSSHVSSLYSTREARIHAPTLLATAERETRERYGRGLIASDDRSRFSEQLTQHLSAVTGHVPTERTNTNFSDFTDSSDVRPLPRSSFDHLEDIGPSAATGRRSIRESLRSSRPPKPQGQQLQMVMQTAPSPPTAGRARKR